MQYAFKLKDGVVCESLIALVRRLVDEAVDEKFKSLKSDCCDSGFFKGFSAVLPAAMRGIKRKSSGESGKILGAHLLKRRKTKKNQTK